MGRITLNMKYEKATREILSIEDLKDKYLYGIDIKSNGNPLPDKVYTYWIEFAKKEVENFLTVKLDLQIYTESKNYHISDWRMWSQIKAMYPVIAGLQIDGFFGTVKQLTYPKEWISVKTSSEDMYSRLLHVVPNTGSGFHQTAATYTGLFPNIGHLGGGNHTPNYWLLKYITGFKQLPANIEAAVGMIAALNVLTVGNETLASAMGALGSSSKSISIDGLSQSTSMYINGSTGIFGARIKQYSETLLGTPQQDGLLKRLQDYYGAIHMTVG
jgi:hypothetical protein